MHNLDQRLSELGYTKRDLIRMILIPASLLMLVLFISIYVTLRSGLYVWGVNIPVAWGFAIVNFVWWIGIGHAGTLISAILLLARLCSIACRVAEELLAGRCTEREGEERQESRGGEPQAPNVSCLGGAGPNRETWPAFFGRSERYG